MTKYESILNALSASKNTFSEEDLLNLYELLLHAYAKGTPARGTIWNVILRDPRLSQFKEKLVKQFLWEYKELLERFLRAYNTPPVRNAANLSNGSCGNTTNSPPFQETWIDFQMTLQCSTLWSISVRENIMGNGSSGRLIQTAQILPLLMHTLKTPLKKYADAKLNPYTGEICDSKGHSTGKFIYFDDYKKIWGKEDFADFVTESVNCTHDHPVYTNVDEIIKSVKAAIKQGRILTPAEWKQVRKIYR